MMAYSLKLHDPVALLADTSATHFETDMPLLLKRGQLGTVVMIYDSAHFEVEFADAAGRAYAMLPLTGDKLMRLYDRPEAAAA
jgi:hypothetical protein